MKVTNIYAVGRNYASHAQEMGNPVLEEPIFFQKSSTCLSDNSVITLPSEREIHYELEIVTSIGKGGSNITAEEAWRHVDGLCLGLDLTDRPLQHKFKEERLPWFLAKSFPGSAVITQFDLPDLSIWSRDFWLTLNSKEVQRSNMDQMLFDIPTLIAYLSARLPLTSGDIIYTGVAFAGAIHKPIAISNAPFILRDFDHWQAYRDSDLFKEIAGGYDSATGHKVHALTYYGQRHLTANREVTKPDDMKGMKLRVPPAPLFLMFTKSVGANATPIAFAEVYLALQQGTVDGQENPLPTIMAKKFYEVQSHIMLTGHITESLLTIVGGHVMAQLSDEQKVIMDEVLKEAASRATAEIRTSEGRLADEFRTLGKTVVEIDRKPFIDAAVPLHNDPESGAGWSKEQYDALQAL